MVLKNATEKDPTALSEEEKTKALQLWKDICNYAASLMEQGFKDSVLPQHPKLRKVYDRVKEESKKT